MPAVTSANAPVAASGKGTPDKSDASAVLLHLVITVVVSIAAFILFLAIHDAVEDKGRSVTAFDHDLLVWMHRLQSPALTAAARFLADLGEPLVMGGVAFVGVVIGCFVRKLRGAAWTLPIGVIGGGILIQCVKLTVKRQRPDLFAPILHETGYSFPSGHALISIVIYGMLGYFAMHLTRYRPARFAIGLATTALVFAIGASRVYVGVHYPTDVLAGWTLGVPWLMGCLSLHQRLARHYRAKIGDPLEPAIPASGAAAPPSSPTTTA